MPQSAPLSSPTDPRSGSPEWPQEEAFGGQRRTDDRRTRVSHESYPPMVAQSQYLPSSEMDRAFPWWQGP